MKKILYNITLTLYLSLLLSDDIIENNIYTPTGGLHTLLENGDVFAELTDTGRLIRIDKKGNIKW